MNHSDVPSPVNFHLMQDARDWESKAMDRPFRVEMFEIFAKCLSESRATNLLELGSGPGFLASYLCQRNSAFRLTLLDFSEAMHELANNRLANYRDRVKFVTRDFKQPGWAHSLGCYDCIYSMQAVHELRHKNHAVNFHSQVKGLLADGGEYLVCDHFYGAGGMSNNQLFMSLEEQIQSLEKAGFEVDVLAQNGSLVLVRAI